MAKVPDRVPPELLRAGEEFNDLRAAPARKGAGMGGTGKAVHGFLVLIEFTVFSIVPGSFCPAAFICLCIIAYVNGSRSATPDGELSESAQAGVFHCLAILLASVVNLFFCASTMVAHKY